MEDGLLDVVGSLLLDVVDEAHVVFFEIGEDLAYVLALLELLFDYSINDLLLLAAIFQLHHPLALGCSYYVPTSAFAGRD